MPQDSKVHRLDLVFKGDRDYLHGTDIIPALLAITGPGDGFSVQIYRMTSHDLVARRVANEQLAALRKSKELCVLMTIKRARGSETIAVTEDMSRKVTSSRPYDEAAVVRSAVRTENAIEQAASSIGTYIERIVALNKRLLNELEGKTDWLFCGLELARVPEDSVPLSIVMTHRIPGGMHKSAISTQGNALGSIVFSRRPKH